MAWSRTQIEVRKLKTFIRKLTGSSDIKRWAPVSSLHPSWDSRTKILAAYVKDNSSVIEFGAGRLALKKYLPGNCVYTPSDLVDRGPGTLVLDLNKTPLPAFPNYDYAVFSGVLEYVNNVPALISHLSPSISNFIFSYACIDHFKKDRGHHGWVNHYSEKKILNIWQLNGYRLIEKSMWKNQRLFVFSK